MTRHPRRRMPAPVPHARLWLPALRALLMLFVWQACAWAGRASAQSASEQDVDDQGGSSRGSNNSILCSVEALADAITTVEAACPGGPAQTQQPRC